MLKYFRQNINCIFNNLIIISLIGFADVAKDLKLIKPNILPKEHCIINIINGRHILQEKYVDKFVPNSYHSSKINQPIKIITGFNSSGKSIYLKQVQYFCNYMNLFFPDNLVISYL